MKEILLTFKRLCEAQEKLAEKLDGIIETLEALKPEPEPEPELEGGDQGDAPED